MIGIIVAMEEELNSILKIMPLPNKRTYKNIDIYEGTINNQNIVIALSGVEKVNAARTTQIILDTYNIEKIINIGVAGSCSKDLNIGDIVIAKRLYQHDFNISIFNHNKRYIPMIGDYIELDEDIITDIKNKIKIQTTYLE